MDPVNIPAKFELRSFTLSEIIRGTGKIRAVPGYAHAPYTLKILKDVCLHGPSEYICQI